MIRIRHEQPGDEAAIRSVNEKAFGQTTEADLVEALRRRCPDRLSLVAEEGGRIVGHILFTPVVIDGNRPSPRGMGLAPMAVLPEHQKGGIGSALVLSGLKILREQACPFVIVLGHPHYYPRFGFVPASRHGLACFWPGVPDEVFLVLVIEEKGMAGVSGTVRYRPEFDPALL